MVADVPATIARSQLLTPNLPQFNYDLPDDHRAVPLTVQILAPRVVRLRVGPPLRAGRLELVW